mmetsp:Transcript_6912/g.7644  ORF Transcript_6912/g.7644 Transcript_6912/m.7644 type:complete len:184 (+) Transcript_6912:41-592(+)|eukprot:CAMPEP_0114996900 /NCGR_PEP_ID=MMETSP0216-20121206/14587_1 /TAXON_ID=223996 /ORGANISM="Protocruzia adherens, Strain Boccale" /LENGTH=183 /DNA_ID=CAMNT_0002361195 /DNA_START=40 /DNA_END=591 /DNA_ORIENTATION=-
MDTFKQTVDEIREMKPRRFIEQVIQLGLIVGSALMIWESLMVITRSESPVVVVLTGSMEPGFYRGDTLFLTWYEEDPVITGDIVVFKLRNEEIPIVHRAMEIHYDNNDRFRLLTKGDNNRVNDRALYPSGQKWLEKEHLLGRVRGYVPYVGMMTIWLNDYPSLKYVLLSLMAIFVIVSKDPQS